MTSHWEKVEGEVEEDVEEEAKAVKVEKEKEAKGVKAVKVVMDYTAMILHLYKLRHCIHFWS